MRRSFSLISAVVTAFSLVMLASVVYAYRVMAAERPANAAVASQISGSPNVPVAVPAAPVDISPQDAAAAAAKFLDRADPFSVQLTQYNGAQSYKVTFSSGDVVYLSLSGQVLASVPAAAQIASASTAGGGGGGGGGGRHHGGGGGGQGSDDGGAHEGSDSGGEGGD